MKQIIISNEQSMIKHPNWQEVKQLAFYKRSGGVELRATKDNIRQYDYAKRLTWL